MSNRFAPMIWLIIWVVAAFGLYMVKFKVQAIKNDVAAIERELREEKKNTHVLKAEWAFLNRPERLRELSAKYLDVKPVRTQQFADFASFPFKKSEEVLQAASDDAVLSPSSTMTLASGVAHEQ